MKRFLEGVIAWKTYACMMFTGSVMVFWAAAYFLGWDGIPLGALLQLLLLSVIGSLLQGIMFTEWLIKSMAYPARLLIFAVVFLAVLSVFAWKGKWFTRRRGFPWPGWPWRHGSRHCRDWSSPLGYRGRWVGP